MVNDGKGTPSNPDHGWTLWIVSVVMVVISGIFVIARVAIRLSRQMLGIDDYFIIIGLVRCSTDVPGTIIYCMLSQRRRLLQSDC